MSFIDYICTIWVFTQHLPPARTPAQAHLRLTAIAGFPVRVGKRGRVLIFVPKTQSGIWRELLQVTTVLLLIISKQNMLQNITSHTISLIRRDSKPLGIASKGQAFLTLCSTAAFKIIRVPIEFSALTCLPNKDSDLCRRCLGRKILYWSSLETCSALLLKESHTERSASQAAVSACYSKHGNQGNSMSQETEGFTLKKKVG